ncbi:MAG: Phenolic acid decarboxylase subunit B [Pelotomaculum sp. PtaB.Bin013]|uniref:Flavin prenyltransferase UbiX n=1 Tax=Pelotomaculum isophthalicicum JI TaxID=947010 RepID=A0A9X4QB80_9FIRM|nr:UbiX family flavin prenyltransferase [Pelotomaculum isophthalicicum]MDF9410103.1 UbiX family flavin prenyltransferase [Pelotomaculum isophthalicicum JI]OPX81222.1 MAG: Phenolic acid decarboxylase subunit B [Pelotomaculum sp. PtaB.Bin013]
MRKIVIAISGATGATYGVRLLEVLSSLETIEVHLVISSWGEKTIALETNYTPNQVKKMATFCHDFRNQGAVIASGSFGVDSMVIAPCSMKTVAAIAHGHADNLIVRSADVMLKEKKRLILVPRETPLNEIHLENMLKLTRAGIIIAPPMPAYYNSPSNLEDIVDHHVSRILDLLNIDNKLTCRWDSSIKIASGLEY